MSAPHFSYLHRSLVRLAAGCCLLVSFGLALAQSEGQKVEKVIVEGLVGYRPAYIEARLKVQQGKIYSAMDSRDDLTYLSRIMRTAYVRTEPGVAGGVNVIYTVSEFPHFRKLQIIGNHKITTVRIEGLARLKAGDVLNEQVQQSLLRALHNEYKGAGMPQARIGLNLIDVPPDPKAERPAAQADLQIMIDEGKQTLCKDVIITGNQAFTAIRLRLTLDTKGSWGFIKNYYDEETFRKDLATLRDFYAAHGYFDARIDRGTFKEETSDGMMKISPVIQVNEGQRYRFGKTTVRGARLFSQADVAEPFKELQGKLFDGKKFIGAMDRLRELYQDHGLLTTEIESKYDYDVKNKILNLTIEISEKNRIYVGKIKLVRPALEPDDEKGWFRGWYNRFSPPIKEETVLREVLLKPGEVYNKRLERETIRRLARLDVFDSDKLKAYNEPSGEPGVHNMVIEAQESLTGVIMGGVGYGDVTGPFIFGNFTEKNIHGDANAFTLQVLLGLQASSVVATYLDRHLGGGDNSLLTRFYLQNQLNPGYRAQTFGASTEWGHPLTPEWSMYLQPRVEWVNLTHRSGYSHTSEDLDRSYGVATGRIRVTNDTRWPFDGHYREGYLQGASLEAGYAGGPLVRVEGQRDQYFPLTQNLTYRMNAIGGLMPYSASTVPINERYFLGGDTDMRGFKYHGAGYFDSKDDRVPIGGAGKLLVKNELLYPLYEPVWGAAFTDVGMLGESPVSWQGPRVSAGVGLRFDLKHVQVALDLALPIVTQSNDQKRFFHFSLQSQF